MQNAKLRCFSGPLSFALGTFHLFPSYPDSKHSSLEIGKYNNISVDVFPFI